MFEATKTIETGARTSEASGPRASGPCGRARAVGLALCVALVGCSSPELTTARLEIDQEDGDVMLFLIGNEEPPCPELEWEATATIAGRPGSIRWAGGELVDPPGTYWGVCDPAEISAWGVVFDGGPLVAEVDSTRFPFRMEVPWPAEVSYATESDLRAAMRDGSTFEVTWTPSDATPPVLSIYQDVGGAETASVVEVELGEGRGTYRFAGDPVPGEFRLVADGGLERAGTLCEGVSECSASTSRSMTIATVAP